MAIATLGSICLFPLIVLPVIVGAFVDYIGMTESQAGLAIAVGALGSAVTAVPVALAIHHLDLKRLALVGLIVMVIADGLSIAAMSIPVEAFITLRFFSGVGAAAVYAAVMSGYAAWEESDRAYGLFMGVQFGVSAIGLYFLPQVLPTIGIEGLYAGIV
ncbi:MAG: MFS transporter, partial [Gammaproteobacteria bacterium]